MAEGGAAAVRSHHPVTGASFPLNSRFSLLTKGSRRSRSRALQTFSSEGPSQHRPVVSPPRIGGRVKPSTQLDSYGLTGEIVLPPPSQQARTEWSCPRQETSRDEGAAGCRASASGQRLLLADRWPGVPASAPRARGAARGLLQGV